MSTGKLVDAKDERDRKMEDDNLSVNFRQIDSLGLDPRYNIVDRNITLVSKSTSNKLPSDALMWQKYPKAAEIFSEKGSMIGILKTGNKLENQLSILELLVKKGEPLFSNVIIPAKYSVDGKEHVVNSQEEFYRYCSR